MIGALRRTGPVQRRMVPGAVTGEGGRNRCVVNTWLVTVIWFGTSAEMVVAPPTRPHPLTRASAVRAAAPAQTCRHARVPLPSTHV